jgi:hypothetical protein
MIRDRDSRVNPVRKKECGLLTVHTLEESVLRKMALSNQNDKNFLTGVNPVRNKIVDIFNEQYTMQLMPLALYKNDTVF